MFLKCLIQTMQPINPHSHDFWMNNKSSWIYVVPIMGFQLMIQMITKTIFLMGKKMMKDVLSDLHIFNDI